MTVPKLRFKDDNGNDYPAWEEKKIKDIAPLQRGFDLPTQKLHNGNYPVVYSNGIGAFHSQYKCVGEAVITGRFGTIGNVIYLPNCKYWPHNTTLWVTDFCNNYPKFVYYLFTQIDLSRFSSGSGVPTLNRNDIHSFKVCIPSLPEQKKIADFFSSFDKRIETTQKKLATLEKLKKGFMQKIFSQQLRFKDDDGNEYPAWEEKRLGEVTVKYKGNTLSKDNLDSEGMYPCLLYGELYTTYGPIASTILSRTNKLGKGMWVSEKDDVVVPVSGETAIDISTATCIKQNGVVIGGDLLILHSSRILGDFLSYSLNYPLKLTIAKYAQGASIVHMNIDSLMKVHIKFPSLPEQQKIADFLSAFDKKIDLVRKEVDTLQTIKKGLLQQMFV